LIVLIKPCSLLPNRRLRRAAFAASEPAAPVSDRAHGAVPFADANGLLRGGGRLCRPACGLAAFGCGLGKCGFGPRARMAARMS